MKKHQVWYIDPPWPYANRPLHAEGPQAKFGQGAHAYYPVMTVEDIMALGPYIEANSAENAIMFLWGTCPHLKTALAFIEACGFQYVTKAFAWVKRTKANTPHNSGGFYTGSNTEDCWLAVRGKDRYDPAVKLIGQVIDTVEEYNDEHGDTINAPRGKHSAKPEESFVRIERMYPTLDKAEVFARQRRQGWRAIGNEIDGQDVRVALSDPLDYSQVPDELLENWMMLRESGLTTWDLHKLLLSAKG